MTTILHITSNRDGNIGGAEKLLLDLHSKFDPAEFRFKYANILSLGKRDDSYVAAMQDHGLDFVNITGSGVASLPGVFTKLREVMNFGSFDIVHTHLLHGSLLGQFAAKTVGTKARILTRHFTNDTIANSRALGLVDRVSLSTARKVVAVSEAVKQDVLEQGINEKKVEVVHNGIDLRLFAGAPRRRVENSFTIGTVGSLTKRKGHEYLLAAMGTVAAEIPDAKLLIIGDGPERAKLEKLTSDLGLTTNVEFLGFTNEIPEILGRIDIYVHAAIFEPFGIALTEAMAAGKCVIAANAGGVPEIVIDGETGILVPPGNAAELARWIIWAFENEENVHQMGQMGRERAEVHFDLQIIATKYAEIYRRLLDTVRERY
jgi:glycosyltransferase involved in cell wall biosynthesis